jgi:hypothetical protein
MGRYSLRKVCSACGVDKARTEFYTSNAKKGWVAGKCKVCQAAYKRDRAKRLWEKLFEYMGGECGHCGLDEDCRAIYDLHHINPEEKERNPSLLLNGTWEKLKAEVDKCILLCSNCHRRHHFEND